jgi:hypothetical protein
VLRLFADQARAGALAVLRPPEFTVMTRENTAQILKDMGGQCAEGECEVETARLVGASLVLSGGATVLDGTWIISIKLHDVGTAALLATGGSEAKGNLEAFRAVRVETERMLRVALGLEGIELGPAATLRTPAESADPPWRFAVEAMAGYGPTRTDATPASFEAGPIPIFDARFHIRLGEQWSMHVGGGVFAATLAKGSMPNGAMGGVVYYLSSPKGEVGLAWWPKGNRRFAVGLEAGLAFASTLIKYPVGGSATSTTQERKAPYAGVELRYDFPLGSSWYAGARAGFTQVWANYDHVATGVNGTISVKGSYFVLPVSASLSRRF